MKRKINNTMPGFTLLELCLTFAIASVVLLMGVSSFTHLRLFQQTAYITQSLTDTIDFAREQAVLRDHIIGIYPVKNNWQNGWIIKLEATEPADQKILRDYPKMPLKIIFSGFQKNAYKIKIFSDGTTDGYQGHFEYGGKKLFINRGGRTRIE